MAERHGGSTTSRERFSAQGMSTIGLRVKPVKRRLEPKNCKECGSKLSSYNPGKYCASCEKKNFHHLKVEK